MVSLGSLKQTLLLPVVSAALLLGACGEKSSGSSPDSQKPSPSVIDGGFALGDDVRALKTAAIPPGASLVSFDADNRLRVRDDKGTSYLLSRDAAPVAHWALTSEEKRELLTGKPLFRASENLAWRFEDKLVTSYKKSKEGWTAKGNVKLWPTQEKAWRPLAMEGDDLIAFVEGKVRVITWAPVTFVSREFSWPDEASEPRGAGYLNSDVIWVFGGSKIYLVNLNTGVWRVGDFNDFDASWGSIRSLSFGLSDDAKAKFSLSLPKGFAVLSSKGLLAIPFEETFAK